MAWYRVYARIGVIVHSKKKKVKPKIKRRKAARRKKRVRNARKGKLEFVYEEELDI
jgi:hypothetical protein